jgi:hypothetical protein
LGAQRPKAVGFVGQNGRRGGFGGAQRPKAGVHGFVELRMKRMPRRTDGSRVLLYRFQVWLQRAPEAHTIVAVADAL